MVMESQNYLPGGTSCPHMGGASHPAGLPALQRPKVTSFQGRLPPMTNGSGHRNAWPLWTNVGQARHSDGSYQLPSVREEKHSFSLYPF